MWLIPHLFYGFSTLFLEMKTTKVSSVHVAMRPRVLCVRNRHGINVISIYYLRLRAFHLSTVVTLTSGCQLALSVRWQLAFSASPVHS
jgi:hypothetical protein